MRTPTPALRRLLTEGSLPLSAASRALLSWLAPLIATGVVERLRRGAGEHLLVRRADTLQALVEQCFPGGADAARSPSRGQAIARFRDSKLSAVDAPEVVLLRGLPGAMLQSPTGCIDLAQATSAHGAFALAVAELDQYSLTGAVAVVENREAFFAAERLCAHGLPAITFVLGSGRLSQRLRVWLAAQTLSARPIELWQCGDYDAAGLSDYLALRAAGARVRLFVPAQLGDLLQRYGKPALVLGNAELDRLRRQFADPDVERVCALLLAHGGGLEQELLLLGTEQRTGPPPG
ncbi:MAG TPA: hypothetical protein VN259_02350 [Xanthomonadales bacterium]|nr:hypothetical protein [Xanthomonadales bacterium]